MSLLSSFNDFITKERLFSPTDPLLVAVSGGLDSVVLCELCHLSGFNFTIVHCNFQLRGAESQRDADFVRGLAGKYGCAVLIEKFETEEYATRQKISIQVAARELRYDWFRRVVEEGTGPRYILTAHHLDDNIETLLMNFFKGTGIAGLRAILPRQGSIIRPLLFAEKALLHQFAVERGLPWVEDSSNLSDKYTRNYFRHRLIPLVQEIYPSAIHNLGDNIGRFREIEMIYRQAIGRLKEDLLEIRGNEVFIPVLKLQRVSPLATILYEIITPFGFSPQQAGAVMDLLNSDSGKYVNSSTHRILKNRNWLILSPRLTREARTIVIEEGEMEVVYEGGKIRLEKMDLVKVPDGVKTGGISEGAGEKPAGSSKDRKKRAGLAVGNEVAWLDAALIEYPLLLRKWRPGDYFYPLGLRKKKKLARFFIDNKLSLADKEKIWVLEMNKKIIWVIGMRIDDRFRIGSGSREVLKIEVRTVDC